MSTLADILDKQERDASYIKDISIDGIKKSTPTDRWKDMDTFVRGKDVYRTEGVNAPEVTNYDPITKTTKWGKEQGAAGIIPQVLNEYDYNTGITKGKEANKRTLIERQNPYGKSEATFQTENFLVPVTEQTSAENSAARMRNFAAATVFPEVLERNPVLKEGLQARQEQLDKAKIYKSPVMPKITANTPEELAG